MTPNCTCTCNCADNHEAGCNDPCCGCDGGHDVAESPTPSPTPLEIAEQGVDESVSRFIGRLHEQIRTLTQQRDRYAAALQKYAEMKSGDRMSPAAALAALEENDE